MRTLAVSLLVALAIPAQAAEVVRASRWDLHSSFWMSLHQTLIADATRREVRDLGKLTADEQAAWNEAVLAYRTAAGDAGDLTFARPMLITNDAITQVAGTGTLEEAIEKVVAAIPR